MVGNARPPVGTPVPQPEENSGWDNWSDFEFMAIDRRRNHASHDVLLDEVGNLVDRPFTLLDVGVLSTVTLEKMIERGLDTTGYVGVDISPPIIRDARRRHPDTRWVQASIEELPFDDASFDVVLVRHVLEHLSSPKRAIAEVARVCRRAALLCFFMPLSEKESLRKDIYPNGYIFHNTWSRSVVLGQMATLFESVRSVEVRDSYRPNEIFVLMAHNNEGT